MLNTLPIPTALHGPDKFYSIANGADDENGNLLFYIDDFNKSIYPNPASDQITVHFNNQSEDNFQIDVIDMTGRQVLVLLPDTKIGKGIFEKSFDISKIKRGIYTYRLRSASINKTGIFSKL